MVTYESLTIKIQNNINELECDLVFDIFELSWIFYKKIIFFLKKIPVCEGKAKHLLPKTTFLQKDFELFYCNLISQNNYQYRIFNT